MTVSLPFVYGEKVRVGLEYESVEALEETPSSTAEVHEVSTTLRACTSRQSYGCAD